jgi:pilus assembly protein CpaF
MLATIHAASAEDAIYRLAMLALRGSPNLQMQTMLSEVRRCLDCVVYVTRQQGVRRIGQITTARVQKSEADIS